MIFYFQKYLLYIKEENSLFHKIFLKPFPVKNVRELFKVINCLQNYNIHFHGSINNLMFKKIFLINISCTV